MAIWRFILLNLLFITGISAHAQDYLNLPANYQFKSIEDYQRYRKHAYEAMKWMIRQPVQQKNAEWDLAAAFITQYLEGSPEVNIHLKAVYLKDIISDKNPKISQKLLIPYMSAMAMTQMDFPHASSVMIQNNGHQILLRLYENLRKENKNKYLEKLRKKNRQGDLYQWITTMESQEENTKTKG
ncbi:hypothetical protein [Persicobacter diffluens]|uniref:Uncharacterized protein n=1 Tax=Persicobacter diffluens TaxID=981 RepID=A0AAN5AKS1_9BACT|nr:hypothetical protein PEDI_07150 [Persicobacter diffluens]